MGENNYMNMIEESQQQIRKSRSNKHWKAKGKGKVVPVLN
jgi:hypothetical protein